MKEIRLTQLEGSSPAFYVLLVILASIVFLGLAAALYMDHYGHWVSSMNNRVVWGIPHVFAIFLIVAASGALNVASVASVFGQPFYKPMSRLSALLSVLLLLGGLTILVLDLGRPDRLIVAMTEYNFKSIFAWNIIFYSGFIAVVIIYLWFMFERKMNVYTSKVGIFAFVWRIVLTTSTGAIFGFVVARQAYDSVVFAPMFVAMSFAFGLAVFILVLLASYHWTDRELGSKVVLKLAKLLGVFVATVLYFVIVYHLGYAYLAQNQSLSQFILFSTNIHNSLFWYGQILAGTLLPLFLIFYKRINQSQWVLGIASLLVIIGGFLQLYVIIIGGQEFPLQIFPDKEIIVGVQLTELGYLPSLPEVLLGLGAIALVLIMLVLAMRILPFLPEKLPNDLVKN